MTHGHKNTHSPIKILTDALATREIKPTFKLNVTGVSPHPGDPNLYTFVVNATLRYSKTLDIHVAEFTINVEKGALDNATLDMTQVITDKITRAISHGLYDFILEQALRRPIDEIITAPWALASKVQSEQPTPTGQRRYHVQQVSPKENKQPKETKEG